MRAPPGPLLRTVRVIDRLIGESSGRLFCWLVVPLTLGLTYEVIARYVFSAPTIWAYDIAYMLYGSHFMLGAAYTLYRQGHIRTDIFYERFSPRTQGIIDATLYVLFFFPGMAYIFLAGFEEARLAWKVLEVSDASPWRPPIYPFKTAIPVATALLIVQGVSEFLKSLYAALSGRRLLPSGMTGHES